MIVQNADYGFTVNGKVDMKIVNFLYWILFVVLVSISLTFLPISAIIDNKGEEYPRNVIFGKICLRETLPDKSFKEVLAKDRLWGFAFPLIYFTFILFWTIKNKFLVQDKCLAQKTFACFGGKHRRNLQTFQESMHQAFYWCLFIVFENILLVILESSSNQLGIQTIFIIYNACFYIFGDLYHGLYLPIKYIRLSRRDYFVLWASNNLQQQTLTRANPENCGQIIPRREKYIVPWEPVRVYKKRPIPRRMSISISVIEI